MTETRRRNTLVVYGLLQYPLRATIRDHLYSFRRHGEGRYFYLNIAARRPPGWLREIPFDTVIFHHTLTGQRMAPPLLRWLLRRSRALDGLGRYRIAMVQDECIYTDAIDDFVTEYEIDHVFSVAPPSEWGKIYPRATARGVNFSQNLTGYLSGETVERVDGIVAEGPERPIDIGYRAWGGLLSFGRHGLLRRQLEDAFGPAAAERGLIADLSTDLADTIHGDDWFRFLASCRYVIGAEGGATVLDSDGTFKLRTERYLAQYPDASFEEVEAACFPGEDGRLQLFAISPRHLEACATRTCQVLVEGAYSGVLKAGEHYIAIRPDLSNLSDVLDQIESDEQRERITDAAYRDVVASGRYGYGHLVSEVEQAASEGLAAKGAPAPGAPRDEAALTRVHRRAERLDRISWRRVAFLVRWARAARRARGALTPGAGD
jgi:hypothetical protein